MVKQFKTSIVYAIGNIIPKAMGFFLLPIYTRFLTPSDYGIINSMQLLDPILTVIFSLAMDTAIFRLYQDCKNEEEQKVLFSTIFWFSFLVSLVGLSILFFFSESVEGIFKNIGFYPYFSYTIITVFVSNLFNIPRKHMQLKSQALKFIFWSLFQFVLTAGLTLWLIVYKEAGPEGYLRARLYVCIILLPFFAFQLIKIIGFSYSFKLLKEILAFCLPFLPVLLANWVLDFSDRIFVEHYFTLREVGIYSMAYGLSSLSFLISSSIDLAYRPSFFEFANMEDEQKGKAIIYNYNNVIMIINILFAFFIALFGRELIVCLLDPNFEEAYLFLPLILLANIFVVGSGMITRFFEQSKKTSKTMLLYLAATTLNISLNFILIPKFGMYGAAISTIVSFVFVFTYSYLYAKKYTYFVPLNWKFIAPFMIFLIFLIVTFQYFFHVSLIYSILIKVGVLFVVLGFIYREYKVQFRELILSFKKVKST